MKQKKFYKIYTKWTVLLKTATAFWGDEKMTPWHKIKKSFLFFFGGGEFTL